VSQSVLTVVLKGYPRLSETFIAQELWGLELRGFKLHLISLRHPTDKKRHPIHDQIQAPVTYLPEYLYQEPVRVFRGWWRARRLRGYRAAFWQWLRDWRRDPTPNRGRRWGQALVLAAELPADRALIYTHFMHTPGSVARYASLMRGTPFALSAHAKDIWTIPEWETREKLADAAWTVTCTGANAEHLKALAADPSRVELVYHGLDLGRFPPPEPRASVRDGADSAHPVQFLSVGRLVAKKGYADLLHALAGLPEGLHWRLIHIGGGDRAGLTALAERLGLAGRIDWRGAQAQTDVLAAYRNADLFVLASRIAADGDRDGLPNVLMEAQSQSIACVATAVSAIPELIREGETGLLVPPEDRPALTAALARLATNPALRDRLGVAGQVRVRADFGTAPGLDQLVRRITPDCPPS
jgi:glycosyltransferase involved in cell wall biosynthesis